MGGPVGETCRFRLALDLGPGADSGDRRDEHHDEADDGDHGLELDPENQGGQPGDEDHPCKCGTTALHAELWRAPQGVRELRVIGEQRCLKLVQAPLLLLRQSHRGLLS